ncbi:MAG: hypothetical protein P8O91_03580 [Luminiphilus sp.]|nr:hypothetical protein [Luminiphilus sp.]
MLELANSQGIFAVAITPDSEIDTKNQTIKNVLAVREGQAVALESVSFPRVVYDMQFSKGKSKKRREHFSGIARVLHGAGSHFINPFDSLGLVNDKVFFGELMSRSGISSPSCHAYNKKSLEKMLAEHASVFIKPVSGNRGFGIITTTRSESGIELMYLIRASCGTEIERTQRWYKSENVFAAAEDIRSAEGWSKSGYFLQPSVDCFAWNGRWTWLRVSVQRASGGRLEVVGTVLNYLHCSEYGGRHDDPQILYAKIAETCDKSAQEIESACARVALATHQILEDEIEFKIGELGMDILVDNDGVPHILEANNKQGNLIYWDPQYAGTQNPGGFVNPDFNDYARSLDVNRDKAILQYAEFLAS